MAKRKQDTAQSIGAALGRVAAKIDAWRSQRTEIAREIQQVIAHAQGILREVMHEAAPQAPGLPGSRKGKGGRPKGYIMSAATKAKLRAAWKRRKAAAAAAAQSKSK